MPNSQRRGHRPSDITEVICARVGECLDDGMNESSEGLDLTSWDMVRANELNWDARTPSTSPAGITVSKTAGFPTSVNLRGATFSETPQLPWRSWDPMTRTREGWWQLPDDEPRIPLLYALLARR